MKISESWLKEWIKFDLPIEQLAALLTMAGLEVDAINPVACDFTRVIIGQVLNTKPHPQADRLTLCEVSPGNNSSHDNKLLQVVCGAKNVRAGLKVALAQIGAKLPPVIEIKETVLRGELSQGMLCSAFELGLAESSDGILELADDAPLGVDLREYLNLNDHVLDIALTPNRADCLSVLGIAREVAALTNQKLKPVAVPECLPTITDVRTICVEETRACPHYCGRVIRGLNLAALTPIWMVERLRRAGIRSINPVVDVTNYVMLELGQPLHAFNLQKIHDEIIVRFARPDEKIVLLDGSTASLIRSDGVHAPLVIADENAVLAIAGVMGGNASAVDAQTTDVFLESAFFTPNAVAGVARYYGLTTESSQRFERGVDPTIQRTALERATELLLAITGGSAGPISSYFNEEEIVKPAVITFNPQRVKQLIGISLTVVQMKAMLQNLGMHVNDNDTEWQVSVPAHRFDIALDVDLIEEIVRLYGYDKIPREKMVITAQSGIINHMELLLTKLTQFFTSRAFHETITYSFVDPKLQKLLFPNTATMDLVNPISAELSSMRVSLWPGLLNSLQYNSFRQQTTIKLFESGVIFVTEHGSLVEKSCFAGLIMGEIGTNNWLLAKRQFDFFDLKGDLQALFSTMQMPVVEFRAATHAALHPGKTAQLWVNGQDIGWCGVLHPSLAKIYETSAEVILFELQLDKLVSKTVSRYKSISKFPFISRDLSLLADKNLTWADIEAVIKQAVSENPTHKSWLKSLDIFDVYTGVGIPSDKKSIAISLILQDLHRTLVDGEINAIIDVIIANLKEKLAITLRD